MAKTIIPPLPAGGTITLSIPSQIAGQILDELRGLDTGERGPALSALLILLASKVAAADLGVVLTLWQAEQIIEENIR